MNADEMKTLLAESNKELAKSITEGLAAALKPATPATPATPVTKADEEIDIATETDPKKLFAYAKQRRIQALKEEFDLPNADADDIVEFQKELALIEAEFAEKAASTRRTRKPASKQPAADAETVAELFSQGLSKEEIDLAKEGLSIGKMANEMAGRS